VKSRTLVPSIAILPRYA